MLTKWLIALYCEAVVLATLSSIHHTQHTHGVYCNLLNRVKTRPTSQSRLEYKHDNLFRLQSICIYSVVNVILKRVEITSGDKYTTDCSNNKYCRAQANNCSINVNTVQSICKSQPELDTDQVANVEVRRILTYDIVLSVIGFLFHLYKYISDSGCPPYYVRLHEKHKQWQAMMYRVVSAILRQIAMLNWGSICAPSFDFTSKFVQINVKWNYGKYLRCEIQEERNAAK